MSPVRKADGVELASLNPSWRLLTHLLLAPPLNLQSANLVLHPPDPLHQVIYQLLDILPHLRRWDKPLWRADSWTSVNVRWNVGV